MRITLSPKANFAFMALFSFLFLSLIHVYGSPVYQYITEINLPLTLRIILSIVGSILLFAFLTYARIYDPILPGPWTRKETKYWKSLIIEFSFPGVTKLLLLTAKIFLFSLALYIVLLGIVSSSTEVYKEISNGTYVYDRYREIFIISPLILIILLIIYLVVKTLEKFGIIKKIEKNQNETL